MNIRNEKSTGFRSLFSRVSFFPLARNENEKQSFNEIIAIAFDRFADKHF